MLLSDEELELLELLELLEFPPLQRPPTQAATTPHVTAATELFKQLMLLESGT